MPPDRPAGPLTETSRRTASGEVPYEDAAAHLGEQILLADGELAVAMAAAVAAGMALGLTEEEAVELAAEAFAA